MLYKSIKTLVIFSVLFFSIFAGIFLSPISEYNQETGRSIGKIYTLLYNRYAVGRQLGHTQICDTYIKDGCLQWKLLGMQKNTFLDAYVIYFHIDASKIEKYPLSKGYRVPLFGRYDLRYLNNKEDVPEFMLLSSSYPEFFTKQDIQNLPEEHKKIFQQLEKNPDINIEDSDITYAPMLRYCIVWFFIWLLLCLSVRDLQYWEIISTKKLLPILTLETLTFFNPFWLWWVKFLWIMSLNFALCFFVTIILYLIIAIFYVKKQADISILSIISGYLFLFFIFYLIVGGTIGYSSVVDGLI